VEPIEQITWQGKPLVYIIRADFLPEKTTFVTPPDYKQQVGYVVHQAGGKIQRHTHRELKRNIVGTSEVLVVRRGYCELEIYNDKLELVSTRELHEGDIALMVGGGHGFRILEDTVFREIKQGPYTGIDEKELF
jgi:uncharacterized protein with PhoU and TrkA domain